MNIVFSIVKTAGISVLVLLLLLIFLLILFLFIPFRYRLYISFPKTENGTGICLECMQARVSVRFLGVLLAFVWEYKEKQGGGVMRVLGIPVWPRRKHKGRTESGQDMERYDEKVDQGWEAEEKGLEKRRRKKRRSKRKDNREQKDNNKQKEKQEQIPENLQDTSSIGIDRIPENSQKTDNRKKAEIPENPQETDHIEIDRGSGNVQEIENIEVDGFSGRQQETNSGKMDKDPQDRLSGFVQKILQFPHKVSALFSTICRFFRGLKMAVGRFGIVLENISDMHSDIRVRNGVNSLLRECRQLWVHTKPKKLAGNIHFGLSDPAQTGQLLGVFSIAYVSVFSAYADTLSIEPDFEHAVLDGEITVVGRVQIVVLIASVWRLYRDKEIKYTWEKVNQLINNFSFGNNES